MAPPRSRRIALPPQPIEIDPNERAYKAPPVAFTPLEDPGPSGAEALGRGFVNGGTFGLAPEIGAGLQRLLAHTPNALREPLGMGKNYGDEDPMAIYKDALAKAREQEATAKDAHPDLYELGNGAGGLVTSAAVGGVAGKVLGRMGRLGQAAEGFGDPSRAELMAKADQQVADFIGKRALEAPTVAPEPVTEQMDFARLLRNFQKTKPL